MWFPLNAIPCSLGHRIQPQKCCYQQAVIQVLVSTVSGPTQKPQRKEESLEELPSPPTGIPLGQSRAELEAQTWRGCSQLLKVQRAVPSGHGSPTPFSST